MKKNNLAIQQSNNSTLPDCCKSKETSHNREGFFWGILYGIIPHTFCILFVILSIVGATSGAVFMKRFLFVPHLFQYLVLLSFSFATLSAVFYLKRNRLFSASGIKKKWKYLTILYSTTIIINLLFVYWILPATANLSQPKVSPVIANPTTSQESSDNVQIVHMDQVAAGYKPNQFTIKKGIPVKWIINARDPYNCSASIYSKKLGISQNLEAGENIIEFTPTETGKMQFSCYMGMYSGYFNVTE